MLDALRYETLLATSERVAFSLDDVFPPGRSLDFGRPFLPESLVRSGGLGFLSSDDRLCLNHIRAHAYLTTFGLVEEFILPFVLDHARSVLGGDEARTRALLTFASEEAKHIALFKRFRESFERGFGNLCETVGPAKAVADAVLAHAPLGVALAILHIEWMTQRHYLESVQSDRELDPLFTSLLRNHFVEECQHAKLDTLLAFELAARLTTDEVESGVDEYFEIMSALDGLLIKQVEYDLESFERARSVRLRRDERDAFRAQQLAACRFTYLGSGMSHPQFAATLARFSPRSVERLRTLADRFR